MRGAQPDLYGRRQGARKRGSGGHTGAVRAPVCGRSDDISDRSARLLALRTAGCGVRSSCDRRTRARRRPSRPRRAPGRRRSGSW